MSANCKKIKNLTVINGSITAKKTANCALRQYQEEELQHLPAI